MWVEHSFGTENGVQHGSEGVEAHFLSLRDGRPLTISMRGTQASPCFTLQKCNKPFACPVVVLSCGSYLAV